jgi:putative transposase
MNLIIDQRSQQIPLTRMCDVLALNRSSVYLSLSTELMNAEQSAQRRSRKDAQQPRALSEREQQATLEQLNSAEFADQPPAEVYHTLLERGENPCSISTMHRLIRKADQHGERRQQRQPQSHAKPRLFADQPNKVWTWDCSKLATVKRGQYLTLYVVLDLFSRYALGWMVSKKENAALAMQLMEEASNRYAIAANELTIHQDRGSPMIAHRYIDLMGELGITLSHSRPRVSNDNPFSESQFRTMKYQPDYPRRFEHIAHAREWCEEYFDWYNFHHHHEGLNGYTPAQVFTGDYLSVASTKQSALDKRYELNPERFVNGKPRVQLPPSEVFINRITPEELQAGAIDLVNFPTLPRVNEKSTLSFN